MGSKLYAQCSSRILKINKSRCHPRKVLEIRRGCIAKKRKWTYKKTTGGVSKEYIYFDEGWVWIDEIVLLNTKERHVVVGSKMLSKLRIFSIHGLWSGETTFLFEKFA